VASRIGVDRNMRKCLGSNEETRSSRDKIYNPDLFIKFESLLEKVK